MLPDKDVDIVIAGGGHTGLLSAIGLKAAGFDVIVLDRSFRLDSDSGRTLALLGGSQKWFADIGAWQTISPSAEPVKFVDVSDSGSGAGVRYTDEEVHTTNLAWGIRQSDLRRTLLTHFASVLSGEKIETVITRAVRNGDRIVVSTASGSTVSAKLLIGADGRGSRIRQIASIGIEREDFGQRALSFVVAHSRDHRRTVMERFLPGGPLASLPLRNRRSGITWVRSASVSLEPPDEMLTSLAGILGHRLGKLALDSRIDSNLLGALHARSYVSPRIALIGDAAHGAHPIHAQGFNMAVADAEALTQVLVAARTRGDDIGGACLRRYEALRRADNSGRLAMTTNLNRVFGGDSAAMMPARTALLGGLRYLPSLRREAIRHGMRLPG